MDNAEWLQICSIRDELETIAERLAELSAQLDNCIHAALGGDRPVDRRCLAITKKGHQCTRKVVGGRGDDADYCKTHKPTVSYIEYSDSGYTTKRVKPPPSVPKL